MHMMSAFGERGRAMNHSDLETLRARLELILGEMEIASRDEECLDPRAIGEVQAIMHVLRSDDLNVSTVRKGVGRKLCVELQAMEDIMLDEEMTMA
jgi:hypothetical protein